MHPKPILAVPLPAAVPGQGPVDIRGLLPGALAAPTMPTIACLAGCNNGNVLHPVHLVQQPGEVQLLDLTRLGSHGTVSVPTMCSVFCPFKTDNILPQMPVNTQVQRPQAGDPAWQGRQLVAALCSSPGHWFVFIVFNGAWWRVDSAAGGQVYRADPFTSQSDQLHIHFLAFKQ